MKSEDVWFIYRDCVHQKCNLNSWVNSQELLSKRKLSRDIWTESPCEERILDWEMEYETHASLFPFGLLRFRESRKQTKWRVANEVVARMILQTMVAVTGNSFLLYHVSLWGVYWSLHRSDPETITANFFTLLCKKVPQTMTNDSLWIGDLFQWLYLQTAFVSPQTGQGCLLWKQLPPELFPPSTLVLLGRHSLKKSLTRTLAHLYIYLIWILYFLINIFCCCCLLQMWLGNRATEIRHACRILDVLLYTIYTQNWYISTFSLPVISWCPVNGNHALGQWLHGCFSVHIQEEKATDV